MQLFVYICRAVMPERGMILVPVFALLGAAIPAAMYRQAERQSIVERLRRVEG